MRKRFNDTGLCIPRKHYMVDTSHKIAQIVEMIEFGDYFTINRPRQFGKTTTVYLLSHYFRQRDDIIALDFSFEGIDAETHQNRTEFIREFLMLIIENLARQNLFELSEWLKTVRSTVHTIPDLSRTLTELMRQRLDCKFVLMIDEVDKSANHQLFMDVLGMLRTKYLARERGDHTFQSVILVGVHDIKTLKHKLRSDEQTVYNSPWNIAVDFTVDLSFSAREIETMLTDYATGRQVVLNSSAIAERLYYYTSGYPYLVSKLCKFIDERIVALRPDKNWSLDDVDAAFRMIVYQGYKTTLFDSLTQGLTNSRDLYEFVFNLVINGQKTPFAVDNQMVNLAVLYGIIQDEDGYCKIHNKIYEQRLYTKFVADVIVTEQGRFTPIPDFYMPEGLNIPLILRRFQEFMREHYSDRDAQFLEREGRLLFMAFLKPIINGQGFEFKEPVVGDERRMDIVITYQKRRYVIELKRWYGEKYHQRGLAQLSDYLDLYRLQEGYLLIYDFNKTKTYREAQIVFQDKHIFAVWV